jgi:N-acetylmuramoyl-L-alanine amidase
VETLVDDTRSDGDASYVLAAMIQDAVVEATGWRDRGVRTQSSYLQRTTMPAVSAEVGYLTNPDERGKLISEAFQQTVAEAIVSGIRAFLDHQYPRSEASS